jgi:hypothetical protein
MNPDAVGLMSGDPTAQVSDAVGGRRRYRYRRSGRMKLIGRLSGTVASALTYAAVYLLLFYLFRSATSLAASYFGMEPVLQLDRVLFKRGDLWYPHAVMRTYLAGTLVMAFVCVFCAGLLAFLRNAVTGVRLALVWSVVISSAMVCQRLMGVAVPEPFPFQELGPVGLELNVYSTFADFKPSERAFMVLMGAVLAVITGLCMARPLLATALSSSDVGTGERRRAAVRDRFLIPVVLGTAMVTWAAYPASMVPHIICLLCIALMSLPLVIAAGRAATVRIARVSKVSTWPLWPLAAFVLVAFTLRAVLADGLLF